MLCFLRYSGCQAMLPATGAPVSGHQRGQRLKELFDEWVRSRTLQTWKFWIVSRRRQHSFQKNIQNKRSGGVSKVEFKTEQDENPSWRLEPVGSKQHSYLVFFFRTRLFFFGLFYPFVFFSFLLYFISLSWCLLFFPRLHFVLLSSFLF